MPIWNGNSAGWYATPQGRELLQTTQFGSRIYMWEAEYVDGNVLREYPEDMFLKAIEDPSFLPPEEQRVSVSTLDVRQVKEFILWPCAAARRTAPWFMPIRLLVDIAKGEKFISFRMNDCAVRNVGGQMMNTSLCRPVIGLSQHVNGAQVKTFLVVSPSGILTLSSSEDQSYEGE